MLRLLSVSVLLVGAAAQASDNPAITTQPKGAFPFSGSVSWGHSLGQGSFVQNYYARDARYVQSLGLSGSWRLPWKGYSVSASQSWSMELTQGGSMRNHELNYGDIGLRFGLPFGFKALGFSVGTSLSAGIPVSKVSRFLGKVTGVSAGLSASRKLGEKLSLSLGSSVSSSLYTERARTVSVSEGRSFVDRNGNTLTPNNQICRADELITSGAGEVTGCRVAGVNGGFNLTTSAALSYKASKKLSATASLALINSFKDYSLPIDEFSSTYAQGGIGRSDLTSGSLSVGYSYSKKLRLGLSMASTQPALFWSSNDTVDENGNVTQSAEGSWMPNFPWWDFRTPGNNYSSFSGSVSYSF
ncbi:MAG: hypothetical protein VYB65_07500 [Myxococcota bacterium]|nr:hypothetical protein [Myxococcota bacterium]